MTEMILGLLDGWTKDKPSHYFLHITLRSGAYFTGLLLDFSPSEKWLKLGNTVIDVGEIAAYSYEKV